MGRRNKPIPRPAAKPAAGSQYLDPRTFNDEPEESEESAAPPAALPVPRETLTPAEAAAESHGVVDPDLLAPVLLAEPEGSPARILLELLYKRWAPGKPLAFFCEEAGMEFSELVEKVERHYSGIARIQSTKHFVQVFEDTAIDAKARLGACDRCYGTGWAHAMVDGLPLQTNKVCPYCEGVGKRRYPGDRHARAIMFEAMGIVGKSKQPLVAIQQNISVGSEQASRVGFTQKLLAAGRK